MYGSHICVHFVVNSGCMTLFWLQSDDFLRKFRSLKCHQHQVIYMRKSALAKRKKERKKATPDFVDTFLCQLTAVWLHFCVSVCEHTFLRFDAGVCFVPALLQAVNICTCVFCPICRLLTALSLASHVIALARCRSSEQTPALLLWWEEKEQGSWRVLTTVLLCLCLGHGWSVFSVG